MRIASQHFKRTHRRQSIAKKLPGGSGVVVFGARNVEVSGFTVVNAGFDAILVARSTRVLISHNRLMHNGDVGVDFNGTSDSLATHNMSEFNKGGGFLIADDLGPTHFDAVTWNEATRNPGGCGVIIAGHSTAGVWGNYVAHNLITFNGLNRKVPGAGVVIATEVKGERVSGNDVAHNVIYGNGLAGVTIHSHVPGQHMSGNQIVGSPSRSAKTSLGSEPPKFGSTAGSLPVVCRIEVATQLIQGLPRSVREAAKFCAPRTLTIESPWSSRWR